MNAKQRRLRLGDYLEHMREAAALARSYVDGLNFAAFQGSRMTQQAVILNLIVIGEAAVQIETEHPEFAALHSDVPWKKLRGMRNRMTHGYFDTNLEVVWDTVKSYVPELERQLAACKVPNAE
ncbi:DUF86 domain-containing protein [Trinickia terrae]|uniref:DUF86 domain-containing protein n=1 Tax=Trinickia terrae TaxID=2571161 RepID=A0A4U1IFE2_9BURK|nr:DUF86 domain-containing protein [Trinickia terrae]TKC92391.1 DUF86 domain-containing protein [Trinickia terrae]